jgi:positive regulator of sigma E activity
MKVDNMIKIVAGTFVLVSSLLGYFVHLNFLFITIFVGANLFQFGFTGFCPLEIILLKLGFEK